MHFFHFSSNTYTKLIDTYTKNGALKSGTALHAHLIINGLARSSQITTKLIAFYTRCKQIPNAQNLFEKFPHTNTRVWVAAIGSYARHGYYQEAMGMFAEMQRGRFRYDIIVLPSVLKACGQLSDRKMGVKLHGIVLRNGFEWDAYVGCALIDMYSKCGTVIKAKRVFDGMVEKDLVALNAMVSGFVQNGAVQEAFELVENMKLYGLNTDIVTWNTLISGFAQANDEVMVGKIFKIMDDNGIRPDVVSWTSIISGLVQNFYNIEAFRIFQEMLKAGISPTSATISGILPASANIADLRRGKEIHGYSIVMGFEEDLYVRSALIDMYAKCGLISEAESLFKKMSKRTMVTWNSMIFGYANHGYCNEAIQLYDQMVIEDERKLNHLTFTAVLTACSHAGMVDLGESLFKLMKDKYDTVPRLEHYACMVDLFGRAGKVSEAYGFVQRMPIEPDLFVWGALLGACRQHGYVEVAEKAAKELSKLEPESAGSSMVLLNLYGNSSKWGDALKVKKMMKKRKLKSFPSRSWIQVT